MGTWWSTTLRTVVLCCIIGSIAYAWLGEYSRAAYLIGLAILNQLSAESSERRSADSKAIYTK
jgi:hypothetical protein